MTRLAVFGASGQVGKELVSRLKNYDGFDYQSFTSSNCDITDQLVVHSVISGYKPNVIVNCAAYTAVDKAENDIENAFGVNELGPKNLAEAANNVGALLIHLSTDYVFDGESNSAYKETDRPNPKSIYGKSKLSGEAAINSIAKQKIVIRTSWVFGEHGPNFVKSMLKLADSHSELGIVGDQFGGPTYAGDIAGAIIKVSESYFHLSEEDYGTYHFTGLPHVSWYEFAEKIFKVAMSCNVISKAPKLKQITTEDYPTPAIRPKNSKLAIEKINERFGIEPSDWIDSLTKTITRYKQ